MEPARGLAQGRVKQMELAQILLSDVLLVQRMESLWVQTMEQELVLYPESVPGLEQE
jgi:hypothetical protein